MRKISLIFLFICNSFLIFSKEIVLDLESAISLAMENNQNLLNAKINWEQSSKDIDSSWTLWAPSVSASASGSQSWSFMDSMNSNSLGASAGASLQYSFNPSIFNQLKSRKMAEEQQFLSYDNIRFLLHLQVEQEFYYLLTAAENLEIYKKNIELAEKSYNMTKLRFENGRASQLELMQAEVNKVNQQPAFSSQKAMYENRLKVFLLLLGMDPDSEVKLKGSLDILPLDLDIESLIERYLTESNSVKQQKLQIEVQENSLNQLKRNSFYPTLGVSGSYNKRLNEPFSENSSDSDSVSVSLTLRVNLDSYLPGSSAKRNIEKQEITIDQQKKQLESQIQQSSLDILNLFNSLKTDQERLELSRLNNELAQASYNLTEEQYNMGQVDRLTLESSQQELSRSRYNLLESKYQYISDLIQLKSALGTETWEEWNN